MGRGVEGGNHHCAPSPAFGIASRRHSDFNSTRGAIGWRPARGLSSSPWPDRRRCIMAIPKLYTDVLEQEADGVGGSAYMLWDSVAYGYQCGNRDATTNPEDARVQDAMLEALRPMLNSRHPETQAGALHGLGHLCHRDTARTIREFLASDKPSNAQVRAYAASVLEGSFQ